MTHVNCPDYGKFYIVTDSPYLIVDNIEIPLQGNHFDPLDVLVLLVTNNGQKLGVVRGYSFKLLPIETQFAEFDKTAEQFHFELISKRSKPQLKVNTQVSNLTQLDVNLPTISFENIYGGLNINIDNVDLGGHINVGQVQAGVEYRLYVEELINLDVNENPLYMSFRLGEFSGGDVWFMVNIPTDSEQYPDVVFTPTQDSSLNVYFDNDSAGDPCRFNITGLKLEETALA